MANQPGATKLTLSLDAVREPPGAKFLSAVQRAVEGDYQVLGELGRGGNGKIFYLARERASGSLVALQLILGDSYQQSGELWLDVLRKLDASLPTGESACPRCSAQLRGFKRFCSSCGADLSGVAPGSSANSSDAELLQAVKQAAGRDYEVLGQMDRAEGGGIVYFARELKSGKIVALRLERDASGSEAQPRFNLGRTMVLDRVVESLGGTKEPPLPEPLVVLSDTKRPADPLPPPPPPPPPRPAPPPKPTNWVLIGVGGFTLVAALVAAQLLLGGSKKPQLDTSNTVKAVLPEPPPVVRAELRISGDFPPGTIVSIDDAPIEGMSAKVEPGTHRVLVTASGYRAATKSFDVTAGQTLEWSPTLTALGKTKPKPLVESTTKPPKSTPSSDGGPRPDVATRAPRVGVPTVTCGTLFAALDWDRALSLCTKEASEGGTTAQRAVGTMYERGLGTSANEATAAGWYTKAADGGDRLAQVRLGAMLRDGRGVKRDEKAAVAWFQKAADQGDADGQWSLADMLERGKGVKKNRTEAAGWYQKAAEQGNAAAQYNLGLLLAKGDGVEKNEAEAVTWFSKSAAQGNAKAADELRKRGRN